MRRSADNCARTNFWVLERAPPDKVRHLARLASIGLVVHLHDDFGNHGVCLLLSDERVARGTSHINDATSRLSTFAQRKREQLRYCFEEPKVNTRPKEEKEVRGCPKS
jgi:hypothetical protein